MLRYDPSRIESLVDASHHQWTYRAGVISFAAEDAPTEDQQAEVMDAFEQLAFAGLEVEQYDMLWVRHTHEDRVELHLRTPRLELTTGKSLNIAPPGYHAAYASLRDMMNQRHGWADPLDAERLQEVRDTAKGPETGERWRLKVEIFLEDWQAAPLSETLNAELETIRQITPPRCSPSWRASGPISAPLRPARCIPSRPISSIF